PYMGEDSVKPFLQYQGKWAIVLGLTSNAGAKDFELKRLMSEDINQNMVREDTNHGGHLLYEKVLATVSQWGTDENTMFVIGATQADEFVNIRKLTPNHFYLVPGVGAQGGSLKEISGKAMIKKECGILVNASRSVIYASDKDDFDVRAREIAYSYRQEMKEYLSLKKS
ncbi:MAG: orotidine-5'-phosphate decarboxylase, partial [Chitinophagaceae bacterium]